MKWRSVKYRWKQTAFNTFKMRFLLLLATVSVVYATGAEVKSEIKDDPKAAESIHSQNLGHSFSDGLELMRHREHGLVNDHLRTMGGDGYHHDDQHHPASSGLDEHGPVILRTPGHMPHDGHPDIQAQNKIIADVFSPDYYQPTWVLDYRYLKTGGRDYTRGPGGQILILPKGVHSKEKKEFPDYDAYLEHLRLSRLSEKQHHSYGYGDPHHHEHSRYGGHHAHGYHGHHEHEHGHEREHGHGHDHGLGHGQTMWHKFS